MDSKQNKESLTNTFSKETFATEQHLKD